MAIETKRLLFVFSLIILFMFIMMMLIERANLIHHENVHKAIYEYAGYNATIELDGLSGKTIVTSPITREEYNRLYPYHVQNEIVGYNLDSIRNVLYVICFLLMVLIIKQ